MKDEKYSYVAIITKKNEQTHYAIQVDSSKAILYIATPQSYANLSRPNTDSLVLGLYTSNPLDITQLLQQSEKGIIAWRMWQDERRIGDITEDFKKRYRGCNSFNYSGPYGEYSRVTFKESSLPALLEDPLFKEPEEQK